jgi:hypothetical protein
LLIRKHTGSKSTTELLILLKWKHAGSKSTAWLFVLLNRNIVSEAHRK